MACRRRRRRALSCGCAAPVGSAGQVGRGGEPARRGFRDRHGRRRQGRTGRLHHGHGRQRLARHQRHDVQETSLRSDQGFHPPGAWRQDSIHSRRQPVLAGALGRRARTIRQAKSRHAVLRIRRTRLAHHPYAELLKSMTGIEMTHVPYKGSTPALTDVIAGHVPLLFSDTVPSLPQIREGKVRALGVSTATRLPSAPEIPPIAVTLAGYNYLSACMVMIANLQYGWTLFVGPIEQKFHWGRAAIQVAFTIFIVTQTWLVPFEGYVIDRLGPRVAVCAGAVLVSLAWALNSVADSLSMLYVGAVFGGVGAGAIAGAAD